MSTRAARRSFPAQLLVALARTSPAYTADPRPGRPRGRQVLAALGRRPVAVHRAADPEAASSPSPPPSGNPGSSPSSQVADLLLSLPPATRLSLRSHPEALSIALVFQTRLALDRARDLARGFDGALALDLAHALDGARDIDLARARTRDRDRDRAHAHARDRDLARYIARRLDRDRARDRDLELARALADDLALDALTRALDLDALTRALTRVLDRALALTRDLDLDLDLDRALALDLDHAGGFGLTRVRYLSSALDRALNDFTGADLRDADLPGLSLTGIRWSRATRWPPAWAEEIERLSVEIEPETGIFEIRDGTTTADASTVLSGA